MWLVDKAKDLTAWLGKQDLLGSALKAARDPAVKLDKRPTTKILIAGGAAALLGVGVVGGLLINGGSITIPTGTDDPHGEACLFSAPRGADQAGHIGWGVKVGPGDLWLYGATEGVSQGKNSAGGKPLALPGQDNGSWTDFGTKQTMLAEFGDGGNGSNSGMNGHDADHPPYYTQYRCEQNVYTSTGQKDAARQSAEEAFGAGYSLFGNNCLDRSISVLKAYGANPPDITGPLEGSPYVYFNGALDPAQWGQINALPGSPLASAGSGSGGAVGGGAVGNPQDLPNVAAPIPAPAPAPPSIEGTWTLSRKLQSCQNLPDGCAAAPFTVRINCSGSSSCTIYRTDGLWGSAHPLTSNGASTWTASFTDVGVKCHGQLNDAAFSWALSMDGSGATLRGQYSYTADTNPPDCEADALASFFVTGSRG